MSEATPSWFQRRALWLIDFYQRAAEGRPSPCRFSPSCSSYARESFEIHGGRRGAWLTFRRLIRCRPFGPSGWDPVPERLVSEGVTADCAHTHVDHTTDVTPSVLPRSFRPAPSRTSRKVS